MGQDEDRLEESQGETSEWQYKPSGEAPASPPSSFVAGKPDDVPQGPAPLAEGDVEWTASEFIAHDKSVGWYLLLATVALVFCAIIYLLTRDIFSTIIAALVAIIFAIAASRKPRVLTYRLDRAGLTAGNKLHPYGDYKSFAYVDEKPFASVVFIPMKRFGVPVSIYLAPEDERRVIEALSKHLPLERGKIDLIDRLMRSVRF